MQLIRRDFQATASTDGNGLVGVAVPFGVLSNKLSENKLSFREIIAPGAADSSIAKNDVVCLIAHDWKRPVARTSSKSLVLAATPAGLAFGVKSLPDTAWCRDLGKQVGAGLVLSCPFGFKYVRDEIKKVNGELIRTVFEMDLREISLVVVPAYPTGTSVSLSQQTSPEQLRKLRSLYHFYQAKTRTLLAK